MDRALLYLCASLTQVDREAIYFRFNMRTNSLYMIAEFVSAVACYKTGELSSSFFSKI